MVWKFWLSLKKANLLMSKNASFLLNIFEKFIAQKRSSSQVSSLSFMARAYAASPHTWECWTSITVKQVVMWHKRQFSCYKTIYIIVFFLNNTWLVFPLHGIKSHKQNYKKAGYDALYIRNSFDLGNLYP